MSHASCRLARGTGDRMNLSSLPDVSYTILPPLPAEAFWPFVIVMVLFILAIHVHAITRD